MPNWVRNKIIVSNKSFLSEEIDKFISKNKNEIYLDFNKIIMMPKDLEIEYSSKSDLAISLYMTFTNPDVSYFGLLSDKVDINKWNNVSNLLKENLIIKNNIILTCEEIEESIKKYNDSFEEILELGKIQINNLLKYNHINWYSWSIENWGSKWNSINFNKINDNSFIYETAWSPSLQIPIELSKTYPKIRFVHLYSDEAIGYNTGYMLVQNGKIDYKGSFKDLSVDAYKLAFDLWDCEDDYIYDDVSKTFVYKDNE